MADQPGESGGNRHGSLWAAVVLRLARMHAPEVLAELAAELDRVRFATWPIFPVITLSAMAPVFPIVPETPNRPLALVKRWLELRRQERFAHVTCLKLGANYWDAHQLADTLCELVRSAVQTGEITPLEGPEAAMEELQLADLRVFRAMRVEFRDDRDDTENNSDHAPRSIIEKFERWLDGLLLTEPGITARGASRRWRAQGGAGSDTYLRSIAGRRIDHHKQ